MSHVRTQIRNRVATLLLPVGTVYASRVYPLAESALPCLLVYTNAEQIDADDSAFNVLERRIEVIVECVVQATASLDAELDDLLAESEAAIAADPLLNGLALGCIPTATEITISTEGAQPVGRARMTLVALTRTSATDPTTVV
jgi:hypothetical protein